MPRAEIFLTSKLWCSDQGTGRTRDALAKSLAALGTNYLDLFLIHAPRNSGKTASETKRLRRESWKEMQQLVAEGAVQSIGVSNFTVAHLRQLKRWGGAMPAVNQVEFHPHLLQLGLLEACQADGVVVEAYGSMGADGLLEEPVIVAIAARLGRSPAQVTLRHALQLGLVVLPKSVTASRIIANAQIFDFELGADDMRALNGLNRNRRTYWDNSAVP